ncbi:MAG: PP2C family protein-serine/threonine phosphatase [Planctomycetota bacterium]|jgi:sigma-B regulation protein RsbU (phosphoserine phosphatase)
MKRFFFWRRSGRADATASDPTAEGQASGGLLTGDPEQDAQSLAVLLDSIAEVNSNIDLERVLEDIVGKSLQVTGAERGLLLLGDVAAQLEVRVARDREGQDLGPGVRYSRSLVSRCLEGGHAERSIVQSDQEALELGQSVYNLKLRAVMCAPLRSREKMLGVVYVDSTAVRREFSARDLALFGALSVQLAAAIETARLHVDSLEKVRLEKDFEIAKQIQKHLLPPVPAHVGGLELAVRFMARDEASGDSYDIVPLPDGRLVAMIGDVTGHGVGAALLAHAAQAATRSYLELVDDLSQIVRRLNDRLCASIESGNFMSLLMVLVDPASRQAHFVNAGHPGLVLVRDGVATELDKTGMVLGVVQGQVYRPSEMIPLRAGDLLFLRTDGVDETRGPARELFGTERLLRVLRECPDDVTADEALAVVEAGLARFAAGTEQDDDLTMLAIRVGAAS